jgi:subtilase family serine protease
MLRSSRGYVLVGSILGVAVASAVAATLVKADPPAAVAKIRPAATIFVPNGPGSAAIPATGPVCHFLCYSPAQLQQAYDFPTGDRAPTGAGQTIVVVTAFGSPTLEADLAAFDTAFNVPSTTLTYCGAPNVGSPDPAVNFGWGPETSADVEYAHAMAPGAQIVLVVSPTDDTVDMAATEAACLPKYPGAIVSQSFGEDETDVSDPAIAAAFDSFHATFAAATAAGGTVIASAGDFGATGVGGTDVVAEYPSSDPLATAVGGTEGDPYPGGLIQVESGDKHGNNDNHGKHGGNSGDHKYAKNDNSRSAYGGEQVWNESDTLGIATGGAPSILFKTPTYQRGVNGSGWRTTADVAYDAAAQGGEAVIWTGRLGVFAGTSIGSPHWAAIVALANELRSHQDSIGQLNPALYALAADRERYSNDFHDITQGNNAYLPGPGFNAGPGYDIPTGLGTPDVANLISDLARSGSHHHDQGNGQRDGNGGGNRDTGHGHNSIQFG